MLLFGFLATGFSAEFPSFIAFGPPELAIVFSIALFNRYKKLSIAWPLLATISITS